MGLAWWLGCFLYAYILIKERLSKKDQPEPEKPSMKRKPEGEEEEEEKVLTTDRQTQT